jgi:hypothetical protein
MHRVFAGMFIPCDEREDDKHSAKKGRDEGGDAGPARQKIARQPQYDQ